MDLLAGYSDDADSGKNTPTFDKSDQTPTKIDPSKSDMSLQAEWESFEKMIGEAGFVDANDPPPLPVAAPQMPVLSENMNTSMCDPPNITAVDNAPNIFNHVDPPILSNMTEPPKLTNIESSSHVKSPESKAPPKLTDVTLSTEYNVTSIFEDLSNEEMPTLTKMTGSPALSPEHSSSRSSSSGSRSSSVDSEKSAEEKGRSASPESRKKSVSPPKASSSNRKDEKPVKRSRSRSKSRSPHRKRRRSSDRKRSRSRSRPREKRRTDRRRRSRSRGKKSHHGSSQSHRRRRSRSHGRHRSSHGRSSREHHRRKEDSHRHVNRDRSKDRHRRSHSRERKRSRSGSPIRGRERFMRPALSKNEKKPLTFKEQMRQQLLKASKILSEQGEGAELKDLEMPKEKPSNLPLNATNVFSAASSASGVTPQMALLQTMAAMHQKAQEMTGVAVPKYYNPAAVNPLKYAEQVQKRKLLWSKNKEKKEEESQWQSTAFVQDQDGKMAAKFRKLMGMKDDGTENQTEEDKFRETEEHKKKTEEMFYRLDKEYEFARMTTHTHRGIGLGFQSQGFQNPNHPNPQNPNLQNPNP